MAQNWDKGKLTQAIRKMKEQLQQLKVQTKDKSQSSFSVLSDAALGNSEQLKYQNQELKKRIKMYEQSLTQKRGAVEIDTILKEKNTLEIKAETKRREENKEITRLKNVHLLMERDINEIKNEVEYINREMMLLEDSMTNPAKLKSHAMRVLKSFESDLRTSKKVIMKQNKQMQNLKRNILNSKNTQKRHMAKIKQIQQQIEQAKKKANIKEISNRLHSNSPNSRQASSIGSTSKAPSIASSQNKPRTYTSNRSGASGASGNLVRQNLLKKTSDLSYNRNKNSNNLMRTSPNINTQTGPGSRSPNAARKSYEYKPPVRPVVSSHLTGSGSPANNRVNRNIAGNNNYTRPQNSYNRLHSPAKSDKSSVKSAQSVQVTRKKEFTPQQRERQRAAMARLTGGTNRQPAVRGTSGNKADAINNKIPPKGSENRRNVGGSLQNKPKFGQPSANSAKDVLKKMKQVKAYYSSKAVANAATNKNITEKIEMLTNEK